MHTRFAVKFEGWIWNYWKSGGLCFGIFRVGVMFSAAAGHASLTPLNVIFSLFLLDMEKLKRLHCFPFDFSPLPFSFSLYFNHFILF